MYKGYGASLIHSEGGSRSSIWCKHWSVIVQHWDLHYSLFGGSVGRHYVELLNEKINFLCNGTFPAERLLVFSAVVLQHDCSVCKGADIHLLDRQLTMWKMNPLMSYFDLDLLVGIRERLSLVLSWTV